MDNNDDLIKHYIKLMRLLGNNEGKENLSIEDFRQSFEIFYTYFSPKGIKLELIDNNVPLYPVPFATTGNKPKVILLGINPRLDSEHVLNEKRIAGNSYLDYSRSYCNGEIIKHAIFSQKNAHYTNIILPAVLSLKLGENTLYSELFAKAIHSGEIFDEIFNDFNFMVVDSVPFYSLNFNNTWNPEILQDELYRIYINSLYDVIENSIEDGGTMMILHSPNQFFDNKHIISLYRDRYMNKAVVIKCDHLT